MGNKLLEARINISSHYHILIYSNYTVFHGNSVEVGWGRAGLDAGGTFYEVLINEASAD